PKLTPPAPSTLPSSTHLLRPPSFFFFFKGSAAHPDLHSFPTRRSSDLEARPRRARARRAALRGASREAVLWRARRVHFIRLDARDRKSTRLNSSHVSISYAVFCLKKKKQYTKGSISLEIIYAVLQHVRD